MKTLQNVLVQNITFCHEEDTVVGSSKTIFHHFVLLGKHARKSWPLKGRIPSLLFKQGRSKSRNLVHVSFYEKTFSEHIQVFLVTIFRNFHYKFPTSQFWDISVLVRTYEVILQVIQQDSNLNIKYTLFFQSSIFIDHHSLRQETTCTYCISLIYSWH